MDIKVLDTGTISLNNVFIGINDQAVSLKNRHFHPYWELKAYEFDESVHMVINPPNQIHGETPYPEFSSGWTLHCQEPMLNLSLFDSQDLATNHFFPWDEVNKLCPGGITGLLEAIVRAKSQYADERLFNAFVETLLAAVYRTMRSCQEQPAKASSLTDIAKYYIERNYYKTSLSVESVAASVGVTAGHLANIFKKEKLPTLRQYIVEVRMEHALRLLRSKCYTVKEVSDMTGWNCQFYFSNCFKRKYGVTPSQAATHIKDDSYIDR